MSIKHCKHCGFEFRADQEWKTMCVPCYVKWKKAADEPVAVETIVKVIPYIPDDMLNRLIRLCHPDRHQNSESSTLATQWLLEVRRNQRQQAEETVK